jgi:hypothetical protein
MSEMDEMSAWQRREWAHLRLALKSGRIREAAAIIDSCDKEMGPTFSLLLCDRAATTFTAGCNALGDPAPIKEKDDE